MVLLEDRDRVDAAPFVDGDLVVAQPRMRLRGIVGVAVAADLPKLGGRDPRVARASPRTGRGGGSRRAARRGRPPGRWRRGARRRTRARPSGRCRAWTPRRRRSPSAHQPGSRPPASRTLSCSTVSAGAVPPSCSAIRRAVVPSIAHAITRHPAARYASAAACSVGPLPVPARPVRHAQPEALVSSSNAASCSRSRCLPLAECRLGGRQPGLPLRLHRPPRRHPPSRRRLDGDVDHVPFELADLARGDPAAVEREQLAALPAFHPCQQPGRLLSRQSAGGSLEHERAGAREADRRSLLAQLREHHAARVAPSAPRPRRRAPSRRRSRLPAPGPKSCSWPSASHTCRSRSGSRSWSLAWRVSFASTASAPPCNLTPSSRSISARACATSRDRGDITSHSASGTPSHLEVAPAIAGARPDRPAGLDQRVGDLGAEQRAALQGGVVAKPLPRIGRHQPPIAPDDADHEVVDVQLRRRRPIPPRPPGGHVQRGRDRRPGRRLPDPDAVLPAAVNDRLVLRHVLHRPLRRRQQRLLDPPAIMLVGHRPQHRHRLRHRQRHLHVRDPGHPLDHRPAVVVDERLALLVARLALEHSRPAQLLAGLDVLPLQHRDQIVPLDRLSRAAPRTAPAPRRRRATTTTSHAQGGARDPRPRAGSRCGRTPPAPPRARGDSRRPAPRRRGCRPRPRLSTASAQACRSSSCTELMAAEGGRPDARTQSV